MDGLWLMGGEHISGGWGKPGRESWLHVALNADCSTQNYSEALHMLLEDFIILDSNLIPCYRLHWGSPSLRIRIKISEEVSFQHSYNLGS